MKEKKAAETQRIQHPFPPLFDADSRILILGSFPSVKSREQMFFYGHPQNRFWKVIAAVTGEEAPADIEEKKQLLHRNHIALWDVIASCEITGSSDASIKNARANDLSVILEQADIRQIFCNGTKSWELYQKYIRPATGREAAKLPSTSPANAAWTLEKLTVEWKLQILDILYDYPFSNSAPSGKATYSTIYEVVKRIPPGTVATYGQIAALAGNPRGARAVGNALHVNPDPEHIPCFRVVNHKGRLSGAFAFGGPDVQKQLLEEDGVEVVNYTVDLSEYQWDGSVVSI